MEPPAALLTQRRLRDRPIEAGVLSSRTSTNANPNPSTDAAAPCARRLPLTNQSQTHSTNNSDKKGGLSREMGPLVDLWL